MAKIVGFSRAKNMVELNENGEDIWYWLTPRVQTFIDKLAVGTEVEYTSEEKQGKKTINFIKASDNGFSPRKTVTGTSRKFISASPTSVPRA